MEAGEDAQGDGAACAERPLKGAFVVITFGKRMLENLPCWIDRRGKDLLSPDNRAAPGFKDTSPPSLNPIASFVERHFFLFMLASITLIPPACAFESSLLTLILFPVFVPFLYTAMQLISRQWRAKEKDPLITVKLGEGDNPLSNYAPQKNTIYLSSKTLEEGAEATAEVLTHELVHAVLYRAEGPEAMEKYDHLLVETELVPKLEELIDKAEKQGDLDYLRTAAPGIREAAQEHGNLLNETKLGDLVDKMENLTSPSR